MRSRGSLRGLARKARPAARRMVGALVKGGIAVATVGVSASLQWLLRTSLPGAQHLFFYPGVLAATWFGGLGAGLLATVLATIVTVYLFLAPDPSLPIASLNDAVDLLIFTLLCGVLAVGLDRLRRAIREADAARRSAETNASRLRDEQAVLRSVIDSVPVGLAFSTPNGGTQFDNPAMRRITGGLGQPPRLGDVARHFDLHDHGGRKISDDEWERTLRRAAQEPVTLDVEVRRADGTFVPTKKSLVPVRAQPASPLLGTLIVVHDLSAERAIEELREEFVAVIAHDLRSPIAAIQLALEHMLRLPREDHTVKVQCTTLERACRSAERLGAMVNDLLDTSRVELGRLSLARETLDLGQLLAKIVDEVRPALGDRRVTTTLPAAPLPASVDRHRLAQVVQNLLENAAKFSAPSSRIEVTLCEEAGGAHLLLADEGVGIAPADLPKLFNRFFQAKRARRRKGGLGLGLYITKGIVDAHDGRLWVESVPDVGTTFHVWLPALAVMPSPCEHLRGAA